MTKRPKETWEKEILPITHAAFRPYVTALGQLTLAWNGLYSTLSLLFSAIMGGGNIGQYLAVWNAITSDRTQREALKAAVKDPACNAVQYFPLLTADVEWICNQANELEEKRNNALHSPLWGMARDPKPIVMPIIGLGHIRAKKLWDKNLLKEFRYCRDACLILSDYSNELRRAMQDTRKPWPQRPKLPNRGDTSGKKPPRQVAQAKRVRPPKSSLRSKS